MAVRIQLRRDTAANFTASNPTLAQGELAVETDTGKVKFGDGSTAWASLAYFTGAKLPFAGTYGLAATTVAAAVDELDLMKSPLQRMRRASQSAVPRIVTIIGGQVDESPTGTSATISADTVNFKLGTQGHKMTMAGAVTGQMRLDPPGAVDPLVIDPAPQAIGLWIYLEDATKVTNVEVSLASNSAATTNWTRSATSEGLSLSTGWNMLRFAAHGGTLTDWGTIYRVRVIVYTNDATTATVGHLWAEVEPKARLVMINDWGTQNFKNTGYVDFKARNLPVTFALRPSLLGTGSGSALHLTEAQVAELAAENGNSISFHSWAGVATSAATADEIVTDTMRCIKWLGARGYGGRIVRSAWVQNQATNASAAQPFLLAGATPSSTANVTPWPPISRWNIPRWSVHGRTEAAMDAIFTLLEQTNETLVAYTHGIDDAGGDYATTAEWAYFLSKIDEGLDGGWLEGTTFERLIEEGGVKFLQGFTSPTVVNPTAGALPAAQLLP